MTDETIPLKEFIKNQIDWLDKYFLSQIQAIHTAVDKAERTLSHRLESMNEIRDAMKDQAAHFATTESLTSIEKRVNALENSRSYSEGRVAIVSAVIAIAASLAVVYFTGS